MKKYTVTLKNNETKIIGGINLMYALWAYGLNLSQIKNWKPL